MRTREISKDVRREEFYDENGNNYVVIHTIIVRIKTIQYLSSSDTKREIINYYDLEDGTQMIEIDSDTLQSSRGTLVLRRTKPL